MLLGFGIGQRRPEDVMHSCGSYFIHDVLNRISEKLEDKPKG